jgi:hypothetical protein
MTQKHSQQSNIHKVVLGTNRTRMSTLYGKQMMSLHPKPVEPPQASMHPLTHPPTHTVTGTRGGASYLVFESFPARAQHLASQLVAHTGDCALHFNRHAPLDRVLSAAAAVIMIAIIADPR